MFWYALMVRVNATTIDWLEAVLALDWLLKCAFASVQCDLDMNHDSTTHSRPGRGLGSA
jgi:hypothetical protein